jgi:hypothetical protein
MRRSQGSRQRCTQHGQRHGLGWLAKEMAGGLGSSAPATTPTCSPRTSRRPSRAPPAPERWTCPSPRRGPRAGPRRAPPHTPPRGPRVGPRPPGARLPLSPQERAAQLPALHAHGGRRACPTCSTLGAAGEGCGVLAPVVESSRTALGAAFELRRSARLRPEAG